MNQRSWGLIGLVPASRESKTRQSNRQVAEFLSLSFDGVEPPAQPALTCRMLVFLRSLSDKVVYWEGQTRLEEYKFELLSLSDLQMIAIGQAIQRVRSLIDAKCYRSAFEELCTVKPYFDAQADHSATGAYASLSDFSVYTIPPVPRLEKGSSPNCLLHASHASLLGPTPLLPTQNSFIHFAGAEVPVIRVDLKRSSTVPAKASRSWDDPAEVSTCGENSDGDVKSEAEDSDCEMSGLPGCPPQDHWQDYWQAQQQSSSSTSVEFVDNMWGSSTWPSQCTPEANHVMGVASAWAQQFCFPGFSVQMMGIVPVDTDGHSLHVGCPNPAVVDNFVDVPSLPEIDHQEKPRGRDGDACCFVIEQKASSLRTMDTSLVKKCNLEVGNFTVTISPKRATLKKGGSSFRASKGQCTAQVKCNSVNGGKFAIAVGLGHAPAHITVRHDFSRHPVCSIPGVVDLKNALDENANLFRLTFEFTVV